MASINDVFNQLVAVNGTLTQIRDNVSDGTNATLDVKNAVNVLNNDVKAGFNATVNALNTVALIEVENAKLLFHLTQQSDTIICILENIAQNTCSLVTQSTIQTRLQQKMAEDLDMIRDIAMSAHPEGALAIAKLAELRAQVERCCPPEQPQPACTYRPCPAPPRAEKPRLPRPREPNDPIG